MIKEAQNKAISADSIETKGKAQAIEYHFPGSMKYKPQTIQATSREEAEEEWIKTREKSN